jgi:DnaJ-class molecular chaperone
MSTVTADLRVEWCRECGGDGGFEYAERPDYVLGGYVPGWQRCGACAGKGETEVQYEPVTMEDMADVG